jgi:hypothetical protein
MVSHLSEFLNVLATQRNGQMTLNTVSSCKVSPQNEFLNVLATWMNGQMTLNIGSSCRVSLQCELSYVLSNLISGQMIWCTMNIHKVSASSLLPIVDATGLNLCSARHPLLLLICLESERFLSAHPPALLLHLIHLKHLLLQRNADLESTQRPKVLVFYCHCHI